MSIICGKCGLLVVCWKLYSLAKSENSCDAYCGPLSLITCSGIPYLAKIDLRAEMTLVEVVVVNLITSGNREK